MKSSNEIFQDILKDPDFKTICRLDIYDFPKPFYRNIDKVKAIVLGADPSNPSDEKFEFVFGLERGEKSRYFTGTLKKLQQINGLNLETIYVQNLCRNYFSKVTDKNPHFDAIAEKYWLEHLKCELDSYFEPDVPVIATAWKVLKVVAPQAIQYRSRREEIYSKNIIFSSGTRLNRPVIALFRGGASKYDLSKEEWLGYVREIEKYL